MHDLDSMRRSWSDYICVDPQSTPFYVVLTSPQRTDIFERGHSPFRGLDDVRHPHLRDRLTGFLAAERCGPQ